MKRGPKSKHEYLICTDDEYELPMFAASSLTEVARFLNTSAANVSKCISRGGRCGTAGEWYRLRRVELEEI